MIYDKIVVYTDGSANVKTRQGGFGVYIQYYFEGELTDELEYSEGHTDTTVNRMELMGIIKALELITTKSIEVTLVSDSQICIKGITEWYDTWIKENRKDVKNRDLWDTLIPMKNEFNNISFVHTRGHKKGLKEHEHGNSIADKLADYRKLHTNI